ncbi:MAG: TIGR00366 family protein [Cyclobacteriaceae bacterium]|nr:TIGR00366 family protein [Cyclobacteriaceae bacterium]
MKNDNLYLKIVRNFLPSPFTIAILLTVITFILALFFTESQSNNTFYAIEIMGFWEKGFWELLDFTMQMVLILVLGHTLALSPFFNQFIEKLSKHCTNTAKAAFIISFTSIAISFFNWGLCLIVGAVFTRKVGEYTRKNNISIHYPILGAAGYSGLMTWHGGFSGSAPLTVAQSDHFLINSIGQIPITETILSPLNLTASIILLIIIPIVFYILGYKSKPKQYMLKNHDIQSEVVLSEGIERLDHSKWFAWVLGSTICLYAIYKGILNISDNKYGFINLNYINFLLFGMCILFHRSVYQFIQAATNAIKGATGIIIQFPIYAGIMGIMKYSGLVVLFSNFFIEVSNEFTFPLYTFISAGIVNTFVPSGGGQWAVQGPIITTAAQALNVPISKSILALSYGDQLTNMLQPFWALPLLGITQLKAKDILPYSFIIMLIGGLIFTLLLLIF